MVMEIEIEAQTDEADISSSRFNLNLPSAYWEGGQVELNAKYVTSSPDSLSFEIRDAAIGWHCMASKARDRECDRSLAVSPEVRRHFPRESHVNSGWTSRRLEAPWQRAARFLRSLSRLCRR